MKSLKHRTILAFIAVLYGAGAQNAAAFSPYQHPNPPAPSGQTAPPYAPPPNAAGANQRGGAGANFPFYRGRGFCYSDCRRQYDAEYCRTRAQLNCR